MSRKSDTETGRLSVAARLASVILIVVGCVSLPVELQKNLHIEALTSGDIPIGLEVAVDQDGTVHFEVGRRSYTGRLTAEEATELSQIIEAIGAALPRGDLEVGGPHDARMQIALGNKTATYVEGAVPEEVRSLLSVLRKALTRILPERLRRSLTALDELIAP